MPLCMWYEGRLTKATDPLLKYTVSLRYLLVKHLRINSCTFVESCVESALGKGPERMLNHAKSNTAASVSLKEKNEKKMIKNV